MGELSSGCSFDQFMILPVFNDYVEAAEALGKSGDAYVKKIERLIPKVYQPKIGVDGRLMEWRFPFGEKEPGHRHISHVIGAYPGNQINLDEDPEMREAVIHAGPKADPMVDIVYQGQTFKLKTPTGKSTKIPVSQFD